MTHSKQAAKRVRQNMKARMLNRGQKSKIKTFRKRFLTSVEEGNKEEAAANFTAVQALLDKAAKKNLFHPNKVNRDKARLAKKLNELG
ncbi:MAG: 30S ribosomal protein S20 [Planctomycetota bacterium]|nr:30S ribosomal protein S20 [Planctomycetota bacterium]